MQLIKVYLKWMSFPCGAHISNKKPLNSGVPQGLVFEPLLLNI